MRILLDHCVDLRFTKLLPGHEVAHTKELGWEALSNGQLLSAAEDKGFDVFLTVDKNLRFQQNIAKRRLALITLDSRFTGFEDIEPLAPQVLQIVETSIVPGTQHVIKPQPAL